MKKSMLTVLLIGLCCALLLTTGCPKKPPKPGPEPTPATTDKSDSVKTDSTQTPEKMWQMKLEKAREVLSSSDIYFNYNMADIRSDAKAILDKKAQFMKENADIRVTIEGHCDERGSNEYNIGLGERRATSVKKYLASAGVKESNIDTISYGEEKPICFEHSESCWSKNRRAHFAVNE